MVLESTAGQYGAGALLVAFDTFVQGTLHPQNRPAGLEGLATLQHTLVYA